MRKKYLLFVGLVFVSAFVLAAVQKVKRHSQPSEIVESQYLQGYIADEVIANYSGYGSESAELQAPDDWVNLISNGNLASNDASHYFMKVYPSNDIIEATIARGAGKNNGRGIVVQSANETGIDEAYAWDSKFWISLNQSLPIGTTLHVEFDYKASQDAIVSTQAHLQPGAYKHWAMIGDVDFTTEWQHFSTDVTIGSDAAGMKSIAFNLAEEKSAIKYYFDNFGV